MSALSAKPVELPSSADKNKQWQRELLMERLRSHSSQAKTFQELSKSMRMTMLEKRYALDAVEKSNLQKCLDSMQFCIKVTTRQGLIERLESLSRQLGLKFMEDTSGLFISSDMFYLEIILDTTGTVSDVKVHHECKIEQQSCNELVTCLLKGDFADFTIQLEGLSSIYQLNAEPKIKSKAFIALQAMETDLYNLFMIQNFHKDTQLVLLESVGIVQKRRGGHPMKLTFFVPPYELLDLESKSMSQLTVEVIASKNIGISVTVNLEASSANKLQILPTVTLNKDSQGISAPVYSPMNTTNSTMLPATFVLRLNKPIPLCHTLIAVIAQSTDIMFAESKVLSSLMDLIVQNASEGQIQSSSKGLFVTLPDQNHCYFFTENKQMQATIVSSVPFTEPSQVPRILSVLRQQALFYTLLASCVRTPCKIGDLDNTTMLEVNAISTQQISVALEHPFEESMATVEFDLSDVTNVICRIYSLTNNYDTIAMKLSKIVQKSMSIPVTIRSLLKYWEQEQMKGFQRGIENGNFNLPLGPNDPGGRGNDFRDIKGKNERNTNGSFAGNGRQFFHPSGVIMGTGDGFSDNNVSLFDSTADSSAMMTQFAMKSSHDTNYNDSAMVKDCPVVGEDFYKSPKSKTDMTSSETSDSNSLGTSTPTSDTGVATPNSVKGYHVDIEKNSTFPSALQDNSSSEDLAREMDSKIISGEEPQKFVDNQDTTNVEIAEQNLQSKVSITPVTTTPSSVELSSVLSGMGLERRPGIEIIPIQTTTTQSLPTSITITPIDSSKVERKSSSTKRSDERSKSDKKRKRKREEASMGPPEKIYSKHDALNRPVSVSIKTTDGLDNQNSGSFRKLSSSPVPKASSASLGAVNSNSSGRPSPKHSPLHNSPKHVSSGTHSPKGSPYGTASPKHSSSGSSGKPSMSTLKSAANSPKSEKSSSSKTSSSSSRDKDKDRDKDRASKNLMGSSSPKIKSSIKLKQIDLSAAFLPSDQIPVDESSGHAYGSQTAIDGSKSSSSKLRKGSLSAVIDKLKSAQSTGDEYMPSNQKSNDADGACSPGNISREKSGNSNSSSSNSSSKIGGNIVNNTTYKQSSSSSSSNNSGAPQSNQNSEYMVKPSLDGMKITINKTRSKDISPANNKNSLSHTSSSSSGPFSKLAEPKRHTGLKPGVNSGPASKKAQLAQTYPSSKSSNFSSSQGKSNFQKSNSSGSLPSSKSSYSSSYSALSKTFSSNSLNSSDLFKRDKSSNKSSSSSKSTNNDKTPTLNSRSDPTDVMKLLRFASSSNNSMDGFMKSLNTKFQIPKLSARTADDPSKKDPNRLNSTSAPSTPVLALTPSPNSGSNSSSNEATTKSSFTDFVSSSKYPFSIGKIPLESVSGNIPVNNSFQKFQNYFPSNTCSKYPTTDGSSSNYNKDVAPTTTLTVPPPNLSKSTSSDALINTSVHREFSIKQHLSSSTPSTPIHVTQSPFASPVGAILNNNTSPAYRPSPSASPNVLIQNDDMTMRPPSAPCAVDMSKQPPPLPPTSSELDLTIKQYDNNKTTPDSRNESSCSVGSRKAPAIVGSSGLPPPKMSFPAPSSVSVHIVKSPVPSPLMVTPSPHSNSPCITDDELMDEALVGIGGK